jgi:energy-coupling factor transporter ATP-binding protein EcfA2
LNPRATFLVGENGSGKSTLIEGLAAALGHHLEGGGKNDRRLMVGGSRCEPAPRVGDALVDVGRPWAWRCARASAP